MRRAFLLIFILVLTIFALPWSAPRFTKALAQSGGDTGVVPGEVVVKLASTAALPGVAAQYKLDPTPISQFGSRPIYRLRITDGASVSQRVTELLADAQARVVYAEPNYVSAAPEARRDSWSIADSWSYVSDATAYQTQWALQTINLATAHSVTRGKGVTVAVLDTGVDATHPALQGRLVPGYDFVDMDNDPSETGDPQHGPYGHGTHVAGIIALTAPEAKIMPIRVLDQNGASNVWVIAEALAYAADPDGDPSTDDGADVINLSLSTLRRTNLLSTLLTKVCSDTAVIGDDDFPSVGTPGVVVVAAGGNGGGTVPEYPAAENIGGLLGVASSNSSDQLSTFSTRGSWLKVTAPGEGVVSSVPGGYGKWNGTSMAAPFAAGEAALIRAALPTLRNTKVVDQIVRNSAKIQATIPARIDAGSALTTAPEVTESPTPTPTATPTPTPSPVTSPYCICFAQSKFPVGESDGHALITVTRTGNTSGVPEAASVNFETADGSASSRTDYTSVRGRLEFAAGELSKTFVVPITDDMYVEGNETVNLILSGAVGNTLCSGANQATLTITDNDAATASTNPADYADFFVRQHYLDFLNREPDDGGFGYWRDRISGNSSNDPPPCAPNDAACLNTRRVGVSAAFFIEQEYQQTGSFIYRFYKASYGARPSYAQFTPDRSRIVGGDQLEASKQQFANEWVQRSEFLSKYPAGLSVTEFVDALIQTVKLGSGVDLTPRRGELIDAYNLGANQTAARARVLRMVADDAVFQQAEFNPAFVLTEYFGYLRRDPDLGGYDFWLDVLNNRVPGNYRAMVCAFINSAEYQQRFSPAVTRNDHICATLP